MLNYTELVPSKIIILPNTVYQYCSLIQPKYIFTDAKYISKINLMYDIKNIPYYLNRLQDNKSYFLTCSAPIKMFVTSSGSNKIMFGVLDLTKYEDVTKRVSGL